ncbi:MAG: L-serine ammonia-lyase, iron-sulfur-dependent, subunit alpha [Dysgonamonadaceae bacterium]|nr:L-serine ammonia-lyase, iron-sulfur-dependent, subunit alpha [Dysgonamonadaceae bacterium]
MTMNRTKKIIQLIKQEVVPAIGCTEPVAVAFAVAKATEVLEEIPGKIEVCLSANVLKNAMGVGIPGTGMIGLPIAVALGALIGKSEYRLEVLKDLNPEVLAQGKQMIADKKISISLKENAPDKLYIEAIVTKGNGTAKVVVCSEHTHISYMEKNGEVLFDEPVAAALEEKTESLDLNLEKVYRFALDTPLEEIRFILESARLNKAAAISAFKHEYGHALGKTLVESYEKGIMGNSLLPKILACTSAACDARMAGAMIPVMTNSGSGNQGITATLPVVVYAEETGKSEEALIRALVLSHLTVIYIKQSMGRLSALCGCVVASTGSACGITYLMGGGYREISYAVQNMIANLAGVICDGAKPSCSLKVSSSVTTALFAAMMAMDGKYVTYVEGIIDKDVDKSIQNLTRIASEGMNETDKMILEIMTHK